jgi:hypothetical protein
MQSSEEQGSSSIQVTLLLCFDIAPQAVFDVFMIVGLL